MRNRKKPDINPHAKKRAKQRYNINLTGNINSHLVWAIRNQKATFVKRLTRTRTEWDVIYREQTLRVIYSTQRGNIVTMLPKGRNR